MAPAQREVSARHGYAGVFLVVRGERPQVVGQLRDQLPGIDNPGRVGPFGGSIEGVEEPRMAAWRELVQEETNLFLQPEDLSLVQRDVAKRELTAEWEERHVFAAAVGRADLARLEVYEGGWAALDDPADPRLIDSYRGIVAGLLDPSKAPVPHDRLDLSRKLKQRSMRGDLEALARGELLPRPLVVDLDPTTFCDLGCPECISGRVLNQGRFTAERLESLAGELAGAGVRAVVLIGGGEPLAHPGTSRVIEVLAAAGVAIGLVTNGTKIDRHLRVLARHATWVRVSMDAGTSATYRLFRPDRGGNSRFDDVVANMRQLAAVKTGSLGYSFLAMTRLGAAGEVEATNVAEIAQAAALARDIGCDYFELKAVFDQGHFIQAHPPQVLAELRVQLTRLESLATPDFEVNYSSTMAALLGGQPPDQPKEYTRCCAAELRTLVTPAGVYVCSYHRGNAAMRIGDVVDESFASMWQRADRSVVNPSRDCRFHCARHPSNLLVSQLAGG
ncbi:MAG TPA: radical SAM protein, partial [Actinomycetota bacterium]|nr:radical SAM protein [Actinomycetota bacterium]